MVTQYKKRTVWHVLLNTHGIHFILCLLQKKRISLANMMLAVAKYTHCHHYKKKYSAHNMTCRAKPQKTVQFV